MEGEGGKFYSGDIGLGLTVNDRGVVPGCCFSVPMKLGALGHLVGFFSPAGI
jgi:hypothetical protein